MSQPSRRCAPPDDSSPPPRGTRVRDRLLRRMSLGSASVLVLAAAAGCSGSGSGGVEANACTSPGVTSTQVRLGLVLSDSGPSGDVFSAARSGVEARLGLANAEGGVHGRQVVYEWRDDEDLQSRNVLVTRELVGSRQVIGLVTVTTALEESTDALTEQDVPVVGLAGSPDWAEHPNMFSYAYDASPVTIGRYIQASSGRKVALVLSGIAGNTTGAADRYTQALQSVGLKVVGAVSYARLADSPAQIAHKIAALGADSIVGLTTAEDLAEILPAIRTTVPRLVVTVALSGYDHARLARLGPALAGVSFPVYFRPFEAGGPAIDRYRDAMSRFAPQAVRAEQEYSMNAYIYTDLFLQGLERAGACPTRAGVVSALRDLTGYDAGGLVSPVNMRNNSDVLQECYAFVQVNPTGDAFQPVRERMCANGE
ncbi:ABC transporter substrate-binding protein [Frankia sp. CH37]|nr:ABC transporter substrate-binding protein [Parafrankia sp. CH37]